MASEFVRPAVDYACSVWRLSLSGPPCSQYRFGGEPMASAGRRNPLRRGGELVRLHWLGVTNLLVRGRSCGGGCCRMAGRDCWLSVSRSRPRGRLDCCRGVRCARRPLSWLHGLSGVVAALSAAGDPGAPSPVVGGPPSYAGAIITSYIYWLSFSNFGACA